MALGRGSILNNRYRIVEILGQGGMGAVYRAVDENLGVDMAVKENLFTTDEYARQFRREAVILANLRHPNLPRVTDHFVVEGQGQYLVMDFIEGEDLRERMDRDGLLSDEEIVILGIALCDALSYLHSRNPQVVHRDIKPGNVKILPDGQICLVDFGLAKIVQGSQATTTGARAMTPGYSPPEQYGTARTDHRTDIYSLAATLYVGLTGVLPEDALARAMEQTDLTATRKHNPKVSRRLAGVIEKGLALNPDDRYQSAAEFKRALMNSRVITGRKDSKELTLAPPPISSPLSGGGANGETSANSAGGMREPPSNPIFGSNPFPTSTPLPEVLYEPEARPRRRWGCLLFVVLLGLLIGSGLGLYYFQPRTFERAVASLSSIVPVGGPIPQERTSTPTTEPTAHATELVDSLPTQSPTETVVALVVGEASPTLKPTITPIPTITPTPTLTPVGGGAGQIAFASTRTGIAQIWLMNADGTGKQQITNMPEGACQPDWSPDGQRLVFISPCAGNQETYLGASLFIYSLDSEEIVPLPTIPGGDFDPDWSPNGRYIVFTSLRDYNRAQVYMYDLEENEVIPVSNNTVRDAQPEFSPNGDHLAFISTRRGPFQIWIMAADGSDATLFSRSGSLKNSNPVWSPDGRVILYTQSEVFGGVPRLRTARYEEGAFFENPVPGGGPMREAVYSPDGFWLAFESWPEGENHDIYIMTTNGLARQWLTEDPALDFDPAWRPLP